MEAHLLPGWNMNGLILEGVAGSGKSTALRALIAHDCWTRKPYLSSIVLSEHQTQRVLEAKERQSGLQIKDHLALLSEIAGMLEQFGGRLTRLPCKVIDTSERPVESIVEEIFAFWRV